MTRQARRTTQLLALLAALPLAGGCGLPWDPEATLDSVRGGRLRVGLVEAPPWASYREGQARGVEVALVERLAEELESEVIWIPGGESELMAALERFELDLVLGGIEQATPWKQRVALTRPFHESEVLVGGPPGSPTVDDLGGLRVAVRPGTVEAALVRNEGGEPVEARDPPTAGTGLVAAPRWQVEAWGLVPLGPTLATRKHVLAAPPGENGWLLRLDRFLARHRGEVSRMLHAEAGR